MGTPTRSCEHRQGGRSSQCFCVWASYQCRENPAVMWLHHAAPCRTMLCPCTNSGQALRHVKVLAGLRGTRRPRHQQLWQRSDGVVDNLKHISKRASYNKMYKYVHIIVHVIYICVCTAYVYTWLISTHLFLCRTASIIYFLWALSPLEWLYHLYLEVKIRGTDCSMRL